MSESEMSNGIKCPSGHKFEDGKCTPKDSNELEEGETYHGIFNYRDSHWGKGQTGIAFCEDGTFDISLNRPSYKRTPGHIKSDEREVYFPTHGSLKLDCRVAWPAIYSYAFPPDKPEGALWLYYDTELGIDKTKEAMCSFMGKYGSGLKTRVMSNSGRFFISNLGDICNREERK